MRQLPSSYSMIHTICSLSDSILVSGNNAGLREKIVVLMLALAKESGWPVELLNYTDPYSGDISEVLRKAGITANDVTNIPGFPNLFRLDPIAKSQLRGLLTTLGMEPDRQNKVSRYMTLLESVERARGNQITQITDDVRLKYNSSLKFQQELQALRRANLITEADMMNYLAIFAEVSSGGADIDMVEDRIGFLMGGENNGKAIPPVTHHQIGLWAEEPTLQEIYAKLVTYKARQCQPIPTLYIALADANVPKTSLEPLCKLPSAFPLVMLADDLFACTDESLRSRLFPKFLTKIFFAHAQMSSCAEIERMYGMIEVQRETHSVQRDRRLRANTLGDMLLGTNKVDIQGISPPELRPRYPKEMIFSLGMGQGLVEIGGRISVRSL